MLVLDTDLLTLVQRKSGDAYERLSARLEAASTEHVICVTVLSFEEQMRGWSAYIRKARTEQEEIEAYRRLRGFLDDYKTRKLVDYDADAARRFRDLKKARIRIGTMDLKIAAIALAHGATLLSRNLTDFRKVPGLIVDDWTK